MFNHFVHLSLLISTASAMLIFDVKVSWETPLTLRCKTESDRSWTKNGVNVNNTEGVYTTGKSLNVFVTPRSFSGFYICPDRSRAFKVRVIFAEAFTLKQGEPFNKTYEYVRLKLPKKQNWIWTRPDKRMRGLHGKLWDKYTWTTSSVGVKRSLTIGIAAFSEEYAGHYKYSVCQDDISMKVKEAYRDDAYVAFCSTRDFFLRLKQDQLPPTREVFKVKIRNWSRVIDRNDTALSAHNKL